MKGGVSELLITKMNLHFKITFFITIVNINCCVALKKMCNVYN
jgi:hypothetical protein